MIVNINNIVSNFYLFILIAFSNYINKIFPAQLFKYIQNNVWFQYLIIFFIIFFSLELINDIKKSPLENFINSIFISFFYFLFVKSILYFSLIIITLFSIIYILEKQKDYLQSNNMYNGYLDQPITVLFYIAVTITFISSFLYLHKQKIDHSKDFSFYKFLFKLY